MWVADENDEWVKFRDISRLSEKFPSFLNYSRVSSHVEDVYPPETETWYIIQTREM